MKKSLIWFGLFFVVFMLYIFRPWGQENERLTLTSGLASFVCVIVAIILMIKEDKEEERIEKTKRRKNFSNRSW